MTFAAATSGCSGDRPMEAAGRERPTPSAAAAAGATASGPDVSADSASCSEGATGMHCAASFSYQGSEQQLIVPSDVTSIAVEAVSGRGGGSENSPADYRNQVTGSIKVTPGDTLYVNVGGDGAPRPGKDWKPATGGFNGGGAGSGGAGGGGATDVRLISRDSDKGETASLESRLLVAGASGGTDAVGHMWNQRLDATETAPGGNGRLGNGGNAADGRISGGGGGGLYGGGGGDNADIGSGAARTGGAGSSLAPAGGAIRSAGMAAYRSYLFMSWSTKIVTTMVLSSDRPAVAPGEAPVLSVALPPDFSATVGFYSPDLPGGYKGLGVVEPSQGTAVLPVDPAVRAKLGSGPHQLYAESDGDQKYAMLNSNPLTVSAG